MSQPISQTYTIKAPLKKVWQALVDPKIIKQWSGDSAIMDDQEGTLFRLWGGSIHGKSVKVVTEKELVQEWYGGDWPVPSIVTFTLESKSDSTTTLSLTHTDVPEAERADFAQGWKDYYCGAIKELLEES